jgi:hypothetical protein
MIALYWHSASANIFPPWGVLIFATRVGSGWSKMRLKIWIFFAKVGFNRAVLIEWLGEAFVRSCSVGGHVIVIFAPNYLKPRLNPNCLPGCPPGCFK